MAHAGKNLKGWFTTAGRPGDRTLTTQLMGLGPLITALPGKTVLDAGCAEGLLSIEFARRGALAVHGVEVRRDHVAVGQKLIGDLPVTLEAQDLNEWRPRRKYDIVVALAILHKLKFPSYVATLLAAACDDLLVLRMPPANGMTIIDDRSNRVHHDIHQVLKNADFEPELTTNDGPRGELVAYYRRTK